MDNAVCGDEERSGIFTGSAISLYEHQSTKNPEHATAGSVLYFFGISEVCEDKSLYSSALLKIPCPVFIVFYNGAGGHGGRTGFGLSQAYEHFEGGRSGIEG